MNNKSGGDYITFKYRYRKQIIMGSIIGLFVIGGIIYFIYFYLNNKDDESDKNIVVEEKIEVEKTTEKDVKYLKVDIKGEIVIPGIYSLEEGSRVIDAINMAGGLTENANTSVINLSKKVIDEMVIIIYSNDQINNFIETKEREKYLQNKCIQGDENSLVNGACIDSSSNSSGKININTATKEELMTLPGIGDAKAQDIVDYRNTNGNFNSIEDIINISGIGESIYSKIKENIIV